MSKYVFDSSSGCARCDNMDGEYDQKPERPHPYCDCEIYAVETQEDCYNMLKENTGTNAVFIEGGDVLKVEIEVSFQLDILCHHNGAEVSEEVIYEKTIEIPLSEKNNVFDYLEDASVEFLDKFDTFAESLAEEMCECDDGGSLFS